MDFVKLIYNGRHYSYDSGSDLRMDILGCFLSSDVRYNIVSYKNWALHDPNLSACGNITSLDKEGDIICLSDLYSEEDEPTELKMTIQQFVQLLDDWDAKVCRMRPVEVIIKCKNDQFVIYTEDSPGQKS